MHNYITDEKKMGAGTPLGRNRHSTLETFIWFLPSPLLCTFQLGDVAVSAKANR